MSNVEQLVNDQTATIATLQTDVGAVKTAQTATDTKVAALEATVTGFSTAIAAQVRIHISTFYGLTLINYSLFPRLD